MNEQITKLTDYYNLINNSTYIKNINSGVVMDEHKTLSGLAFNTGQLSNKQQNIQPSTASTAYADGTKVQSNYMNIKNVI
jgi:hypothetical protein